MNIQAEDLLRIDIDQAVRKLSSNRFKTATDALIELVVLAASTDPQCLSIKIKQGRIVVDADGGIIDAAFFRYTALLFDPTAAQEVRIESLRNLETSPGPVRLVSFLAAFSEPWRRIFVEQRGIYAEGSAFLPGRPPIRYKPDTAGNTRTSQRHLPHSTNGFRIVIEGNLGKTSLVTEVASRCRFSTVSVYVNREQVNRGFHLQRCLIQRPFQLGDESGIVGIPIEGDLSVLYRLNMGIVVEEIALNERRGLILEAAMECGRNDTENRILYEKVRDKGRELYADAAALYALLKGSDREALKMRLLKRYEHSFERSLVDGVLMFSESGGTCVDLFEIKRRANADDVFAVDDDLDVSQFSTENRFVLILTQRERKFLSAALGIHPPSPPRRVSAETRSRRLRRFIRAFKDLFRAGGTPVDLKVLTVYEREFLAALKASLPKEFEVAFCNESSFTPPFRSLGKTVIHIPRKHPATPKMVSAVLRDPAYIRWAAALLTRGSLPIR